MGTAAASCLASASPATVATDPRFIDPAAAPPPALRPVLAAPAAAPPPVPPDEPRVPNLAPGTWRCASYLKEMIRGGAVLRIDSDRGGFILEAADGRELARAARTSDLAYLLDGLAGKVRPKGRVIVSIGKLAPRVAQVRLAGESLGAMVKAAVEREIARRTAEFDAECAALDAADLGGAEVAHA